MHEAADAVKVFGSGAPSGFAFARKPSETAVIIGDKAPQDAVGGIQITGARQAEFADQAILQHAPETFHAALGLGAVGSDVGDAELIQGAAELSGFALASQFFFDGPVVVVANEDAVAIAVEGQGDTAVREQAAKQVEIALGGFSGKERSFENLAGGVVLKT